jgi:hypothetical protein
LTLDNAFASLVNKVSSCNKKLLIKPKDVKGSYLINKLEGSHSCGGIMPPGGKLPRLDIEKIKAWICQGAPNN